MWQLTPPYKADLYICFTANKCSHKYDLIVGMNIKEMKESLCFKVGAQALCVHHRGVFPIESRLGRIFRLF